MANSSVPPASRIDIGGAAQITREQAPLPPFLRWAGSKRRLLPDLLSKTPATFSRYVEPFGGSLCFFFELRPAGAILSDFNHELIDTYLTVRAHPYLTSRLLQGLESAGADYYHVREESIHSLNAIERAARFIFLNRHCFNGVYRTNAKGEFNVPKGTRVGSLPSTAHLNRCSIALRRASLYALDFEDTVDMTRKGDFLYLDPPYAKANSRIRGEYGKDSFGVKDLARLKTSLERADRRGVTFLLSYAKCDEIEPISAAWNTTEIVVSRQVAGFQRHRHKVSEVLISNAGVSRTAAKPL